MKFLNRISKSKYFFWSFIIALIDHGIDFIDHRMDFIDHELISKHLGDFFAKSSIITITITIIIDVPRTARALLAVNERFYYRIYAALCWSWSYWKMHFFCSWRASCANVCSKDDSNIQRWQRDCDVWTFNLYPVKFRIKVFMDQNATYTEIWTRSSCTSFSASILNTMQCWLM